MRNFEQRKAEVFRRSEDRIRTRRKRRNCILMCCIPLCLILAVWSAGLLPTSPRSFSNTDCTQAVIVSPTIYDSDGDSIFGDEAGSAEGIHPGGTPPVSVDTFSFSLVWGCYGISSYDSETGRLVKTTDATNPEDYVTTLRLDGTQQFEVWELLWNLDIEEYPDEYDPHNGRLASSPSMTLILTMRFGDQIKTVRAENIAFTFESNDPKGQKFLDVCKGIRDILTETDEWNALPEYEFFYD